MDPEVGWMDPEVVWMDPEGVWGTLRWSGGSCGGLGDHEAVWQCHESAAALPSSARVSYRSLQGSWSGRALADVIL